MKRKKLGNAIRKSQPNVYHFAKKIEVQAKNDFLIEKNV